ncbi:MAG: sulfotransferase family 2 domain-containing protein [Promethearchaeota archaeon]
MVIISHKHKFIYIKTKKTASSSIQVLLENYCGKDDIITPLNKPTTNKGFLYNERARNYRGIKSIIKILKHKLLNFLLFPNRFNYLMTYLLHLKIPKKKEIRIIFGRFVSHMSAEEVKIKVGNLIWKNYFKFTFERNPWDKVVSAYHHLKPNLPFDEWIKNFSPNLKSQPVNYSLYCINGKLELDLIGKFENLKKDLKIIFNKLSLPYNDLPNEKKVYRKNGKDYRDYYNENSKNIVEKNYNEEIKLFGYKF